MRTFQLMNAMALLGLTVAIAGGCATDRQVVAQAAQFHDTLEPAVIEPNDDPRLAAYLQAVGDRIIRAARETAGPEQKESEWMFSDKMRFHFVNSKTLNAFTTGGEHMYIYTQLFLESKTEDELAAVMAHEFAHVYGRHVHSGMNRQYAFLGAAAAAGAAGYAIGGSEKGGEYAGLGGGAALLAGQFIGANFTRRDESEADKLGFQFYTRAGWDPNKFGDFFKSMIDKGYDKGPEFLSDHPSLASRYEQAREWAEELPPSARRFRQPPVADAREFRVLQDRAREVAARMPSDQTLAGAQKIAAALPRSCLMRTVQEDQRQAQREVLSAAERARERELERQKRQAERKKARQG
jgi:predicted Zn-dependent protease